MKYDPDKLIVFFAFKCINEECGELFYLSVRDAAWFKVFYCPFCHTKHHRPHDLFNGLSLLF